MAGAKLVVKWPHLGKRIAAARKAAGLTQPELAEALNVDSNGISRYETGRVKPPRKAMDTLVLLLKRPPEYFVDKPLDDAQSTHTERDDKFAGLPNLRALMLTTDWRDASERARALVIDEAGRSGGDLLAREWLDTLALYERRVRRQQADGKTRDALGRPAGEEDVVEDPDDS